ncbi:MAG: ABC transporter permease [Candidatus Thermoplasmatota archaeon]|nr:ABC transporter permease [Candidatus Thermoplasmatota archaeon]
MIPSSIKLTIRNIRVNVDPGTLAFLLGLPVLYFFVLGLMFQGIVPDFEYGTVKISYVSFLAPGIIGMQTLTAGNIGGSLLWADRRWGMFEQLMVGPFRRSDYLLGVVFVSIVFSLGGSLIMLGFAFSANATFILSTLSIPYIIVALIIGTVFFTSLFLIIAVVAKSMQAYNTITIVLFFFLDFASTAFYPITSSTPIWLRAISSVNPVSLVCNIVRDSMVSGISSATMTSTLEMTGIMALFFVLAMVMYRRVRVGA